jgi:Helix-turn-helix.
MIEDYQVGELMREIRKQKGLTTTELATLLEISQPKLSRIETGLQPVTIPLLSKFCIVCQIALTDFFSLLENRTHFRQHIREGRSDYVKLQDETLNDIFSSLPTEQKQSIIDMIQTFTSGKNTDPSSSAGGPFRTG